MNSLIATNRRWATSLAVSLLGVLLVVTVVPADLPKSRAVTAQELTWVLPVAASVDSDAALSVIQQRRLWGSGPNIPGLPGLAPASGGEEKPLTRPDWRISGVVTEGAQLVLLITIQGEFLPKTIRIGDTLPGGAKVTAIQADRVVALLDGHRVSLSTFPQ